MVDPSSSSELHSSAPLWNSSSSSPSASDLDRLDGDSGTCCRFKKRRVELESREVSPGGAGRRAGLSDVDDNEDNFF